MKLQEYGSPRCSSRRSRSDCVMSGCGGGGTGGRDISHRRPGHAHAHVPRTARRSSIKLGFQAGVMAHRDAGLRSRRRHPDGVQDARARSRDVTTDEVNAGACVSITPLGVMASGDQVMVDESARALARQGASNSRSRPDGEVLSFSGHGRRGVLRGGRRPDGHDALTTSSRSFPTSRSTIGYDVDRRHGRPDITSPRPRLRRRDHLHGHGLQGEVRRSRASRCPRVTDVRVRGPGRAGRARSGS